MTAGALPAPVRRYLRRPLWWAGLAAALAAVGVATDIEAASRERASRRKALALQGSVSEQYRRGNDVPVVYDNPVTGQRLEVTVRVFDDKLVPDPGARVSLLVDPDDPEHVSVAGDRYPTVANLGWYVAPVALPLTAWAARRWSVRRTRRLLDSPAASFAMTGALGAAPRSGRRPRLDVYPLDAAAGAAPLCGVPVLTTGGAPLGPPFPIEVKGGPRPLGRMGARRGDRLLWPAGRAALTATAPRPPGPPPAVAPPAAPAGVTAAAGTARALAWWRTVPVELVGLALATATLVVVTLVTLANARQARAIERDGVPVLARIVGHDDAGGLVVVAYRLPGAETEQQGTAAVDLPSDHPVGRVFPARVDPRRPATLRVAMEPYEAREPILWSLVPVTVAAGMLARRRAEWRAVRRTGATDDWRAVVGRVLQADPRQAAVGLSGPGDAFVRCVVHVAAADAHSLAGAPAVALEAAGVLEPGEWVAVRSGTRPLAVLGPATALPAPRRPGWRAR